VTVWLAVLFVWLAAGGLWLAAEREAYSRTVSRTVTLYVDAWAQTTETLHASASVTSG